MEIVIKSLIEGARQADGLVVIIDVFRAFTTASVAFSRNAKKIYLVAEIDEALKLRDDGVVDICMGEVDGIRPQEFDYGNSPYEISTANVDGKVIAQSTRAGTVGATSVNLDNQIYVCSFPILTATANSIISRSPKLVTIVAMGDRGLIRTDEDEICALSLRNRLQGREVDSDGISSVILSSDHSQKFDDKNLPHYPPMDRDMALNVDSYDFAISVSRQEGLLVAEPESL